MHPQGLSLLDIMKNKDQNGNVADEVFAGLKKFFSEKFLALSMNEEIQLQHRQLEYKDLMKKALMLSYMMMNINAKNIKVTLNVNFWLQRFTSDLKKKHGHNYQQKIADWDRIGNEIVQIFMIKLMINLH